MAKIAPLGERLSGMCGSVQHVRLIPSSGGLGFAHHPACSFCSYHIGMYMTLEQARRILDEVREGIDHPVALITQALFVTGDL